jgi:hypothetical protein
MGRGTCGVGQRGRRTRLLGPELRTVRFLKEGQMQVVRGGSRGGMVVLVVVVVVEKGVGGVVPRGKAVVEDV